MNENMLRVLSLAVLLAGNQACSWQDPLRDRKEIEVCTKKSLQKGEQQAFKLLLCRLGGRNDKEKFSSTVEIGQSDDRLKNQWLLNQLKSAEFRKRTVVIWDSSYYLLFLTSKGDVICAARCDDDNFQFVEAKKTFWCYYVGFHVPFRGSVNNHGKITGLKEIVWKMTK